MKILITGGCGYIGESVFEELNQNHPGLDVINYDNLSKKNYSFFINNKFHRINAYFEQGDLLDTKRLIKSLSDVDVVLHIAGLVTTPFADHTPHLFEQNNHWGTSSLMSAIEQTNVKRIVYLSTSTVYGSRPDAANEETPPNPETFYCVSKYQAEKQFQRIVNDREVFILRSGNVYGYNTSMRMDAFINKFMFEGHFHNKIKIIGDGEQFRPVIHVKKLAHIIAQLISSEVEEGIYNVAQYNLTINEVAQLIQQYYPELDIIHTSQNMPMRSLQLETPCTLYEKIKWPETSMADELQEMHDRFSFNTPSF